MKLISFFLALILMFSIGTNTHAERINIEKLNYELGLKSLKQNELEEAIKYFNLVIDKNPLNVEAHYNLAISYKKLGQHENALKHFNVVVKLLNSPMEDESDLAGIARLKAKSSENFDIYTQVKAKENDYIDLGDMHSDINQCKAAIEYYNLALRLNPYNDNTYYKVSLCYIQLGDYNTAEPYIRRALELDTANPKYQYYNDLIAKNSDSPTRIALENLNETDALKEYEDKYFNKELFEDELPDKPSEKSLISEYYEDSDQKEILEKLSQQNSREFSYKQSQELDYLDLGDLHFDNQDYQNAIQYYNMALGVNPDNDYTHYKLSRSYIETGEFKKADKSIEKAMSLSGKNRKYEYFKTRITNSIEGKPFADSEFEPVYQADSGFFDNELPQEKPPEFLREERSILERIKNAVSSIKIPHMPKLSMKMPEFKMPTLIGKVEKERAARPEKQEETIFNKDLKRYKIAEKLQQAPSQEIGQPEPVRMESITENYNRKGVEFFQANNLIKAEDYFKKAIQLRPMDPRGYNNMANVEFKRGNYEKAKEYALKAVAIDPEFPQGYYNLGLISKKQNDFQSEIYYLDKAISADSKYYQAYFARGVSYYNRGDNENAKYNFAEVLKLKGDHYLASQNLGIIFANELNYPQAERYLQQAVRLNRNNPQSYFYLGFSQQNLGKTFEAIENFERSIELDPNNYRAHVALSKAYESSGQGEKALNSLISATEKNPSNAEIYNYLGLMSLKVEQYEGACKAFSSATQKNPNRPIYHYNLSQCYLTLGKRKESNLAFQRAVNIIPMTVQDYIDLGEIFFDRGMTSYAIQNLKMGIDQLPENDYLHLVLADFYERTGAIKSAREVLEKYLNRKDFEENTFSLLVRKRLNELEQQQ